MNRFPKFLSGALLALALGSGLKASIMTEVSVLCADGTRITSSSAARCGITSAQASVGGVFVTAEYRGPGAQFPGYASASVTSLVLLTFVTGDPGAIGGLYTPCFVLGMDARSGGGQGSAFLRSPEGTVGDGVSSPPASQHTQTCGPGVANQRYIPFQFGVPQVAEISMSAHAAGNSSDSDVEVQFSGFQVYKSPGVPEPGSVVIDYSFVPEPATGVLMLAAPVLLLLRKLLLNRMTRPNEPDGTDRRQPVLRIEFLLDRVAVVTVITPLRRNIKQNL